LKLKHQIVKNNTLKYYNNNADELSSRYNSVDFGSIQKSVSSYLTGAKRILEIGCGSGRDAIYMVNNGFDIIGIDGS
jgi:2-polyprenyl-3-methyl-5-hydroxy-6-metoxy-1,4-benzoquinol methylase